MRNLSENHHAPFKIIATGDTWGWVYAVHKQTNIEFQHVYYVLDTDKDWRETDKSFQAAFTEVEEQIKLWQKNNPDWAAEQPETNYWEELAAMSTIAEWFEIK